MKRLTENLSETNLNNNYVFNNNNMIGRVTTRMQQLVLLPWYKSN